MDIVERLDGPHEWGYRDLTGDGFIYDPAPNDAAREIERLRATVVAVRDWTKRQDDVVWYDNITTLHDLCEQALNDLTAPGSGGARTPG